MPNTFTIKITDATLQAFVGVYPAEQQNTQPILINIAVIMPATNFITENINTTINYEIIWQIVEDVFKNKWQLLESAAVAIAQKIAVAFNQNMPTTITLTKLETIMPNCNGKVGISYCCNG